MDIRDFEELQMAMEDMQHKLDTMKAAFLEAQNNRPNPKAAITEGKSAISSAKVDPPILKEPVRDILETMYDYDDAHFDERDPIERDERGERGSEARGVDTEERGSSRGVDRERPLQVEERGPRTPPRKRDRDDKEQDRGRKKKRYHGDGSRSPSRSPHRDSRDMDGKDLDPNAPPVECAIFVSEIPTRVTDNELKDAFAKIAPVYDATIVINRITKQSKGFAFVRFFSMEDITKVLEAEAPEFEDDAGRRFQKVKLRLADPKNTLSITGLPRSWPVENIEVEIKKRVETPFSKIELSSPGHALVSYKDHDTALVVMRSLQHTVINDRRIYINMTESRNRERKDDTIKSLFVKGIHPDVNIEILEDLFGREALERVVIPVDRMNNQTLGHAYAHFKTREDAEDAMSKFEGFELRGRRLHLDWPVTGTKPRLPSYVRNEPPARDRGYRSAERDRGVERDRGIERDRGVERDRGIGRDRGIERDQGVDRDRMRSRGTSSAYGRQEETRQTYYDDRYRPSRDAREPDRY